MYNFFVDEHARQGDLFYIVGTDYNHICNVLRMQPGDTFLISCSGLSCLCKLAAFEHGTVVAEVIEENFQNTELPVKFHLFQGLPKGDKLELIIQKAVELGVSEIIPVEMSRSVVKLDDKKKKSKLARWQSIAESAAKQSKRNIIPQVSDVLTYERAIAKAEGMDLFLVPYENERGMRATKEAILKIQPGMSVGILIGPEGGFDEREIAQAKDAGADIVSLGSRILRAETAAFASLSMVMLYTEMNLGGENQ